MKYILLDTCVWIDMAKLIYENDIYNMLNKLLDENQITLLLPDLVLDEWERNKQDAISNRQVKLFRDGMRQIKNLSVLVEPRYRDEFNNLLGYLTPTDQILKLRASEKIREFDNIIMNVNGKTNIVKLEITDEIKINTVRWAIDKKAPCHKKSSMADALILFSGIKYFDNLGEIDNIEKIFITHNKQDFSSENNATMVHNDLQEIFEKGNIKYCSSFARFMSEIENSIISYDKVEQVEKLIDIQRCLSTTYQSEPLCYRCGNTGEPRGWKPSAIGGLTWHIYCNQCKALIDTGEFYD